MAELSKKAAQYREHRKVMELAVELGCTPNEAKATMRQIEAREEHRALCRKHGVESILPPLKLPTNRAEFERWDAPWMLRS